MATVATRRENNDVPRTAKIDLTPTGLLMEGDYTQNPNLQIPKANLKSSPLRNPSVLDRYLFASPSFESRTAQEAFRENQAKSVWVG